MNGHALLRESPRGKPTRPLALVPQRSRHLLVHGDARDLSFLADESAHLVVTSPPYWTLKQYPDDPGQLGAVAEYEAFVAELGHVWRECFRILVPGGRLVCIVGDVCLARRRFGRHVVMPLHADITVTCRKIGFDNLNPIIWLKIANATLEMERPTSFLGKPYEPNAIIKNDIEFILMQRKPGGYRKPTAAQRDRSRITKPDFQDWFQQVWRVPGAATRQHPAPFPLEVAARLVRMFSFVGDTMHEAEEDVLGGRLRQADEVEGYVRTALPEALLRHAPRARDQDRGRAREEAAVS